MKYTIEKTVTVELSDCEINFIKRALENMGETAFLGDEEFDELLQDFIDLNDT